MAFDDTRWISQRQAKLRSEMRINDARRRNGELPALVTLTPEQDRVAELEELSGLAMNHRTRWIPS